MIASHHAGQITFYEELGVAPGASAEEIRDAFRALVRLLHPDQQTDAQLKNIAEKQMRKLNRIYEVLSDPEQRRRYDDALDDDYTPTAVVAAGFKLPVLTKLMARVAWSVAILASVGLLVWLTSDGTPGPQSRVLDQNAPAPSTPTLQTNPFSAMASQESVIAGLRSNLRVVTLERDAAIHELNRLRGTEPAPQPASPVRAAGPARTEGTEIRTPAITLTELPPASRLPAFANPSLPRTENPASRKLAGFWFYAVPPQGQRNKNQALYPPEFIEATIMEENGVIYGKYRARFQILDRAISPDVNFTFTGSSSAAPPTTFPWTGSGGAKGEITLRFMSENSLRVDWNASELGTQQGLDAGTAILTRRIE